MNQNTPSTHWADITAEKIIREKGEKDIYTCASGITPSGTVHIGNFREIISVELVVRALRDKGRKVRFIYSWDDYDVFRKVPKNMPKQELLQTYLRKPITHVPDPFDNEESYARFNEKDLETVLPIVGVEPEYIYQAGQYNKSVYAEGIRKALEKTDTIKAILNEHRSEPLADNWYPVSVFCTKCDKDTTEITGWDGGWCITYVCSSCGNEETLDLRTSSTVKLPWRVDWPMRWAHEGVDFEPAGKEHHSAGGSFDTAHRISEDVYGYKAPVTFKYDFITLKGMGGKISSSAGNVISLTDTLEVYQPEVVRYLFAGTRPNTEFAISFDLDVLKVYEDYDKCERAYFSKPDDEKKLKEWAKLARIYELSQVRDIPKMIPYQIQIRHLCNLLQIFSGDIDAVIEYLGDMDEDQIERFRQRAQCAWNWVNTYAPEDFRFALNKPEDPPAEVPDKMRPILKEVADLARDKMDSTDENGFGNQIYDIMKKYGVESPEFFPAIYTALIGKEKGPRLISFLYTIGKDTIYKLLSRY